MDLQFGLDTFGDVTVDGAGKPVTQAQVIRDVVAQGVPADSLGVDCFATIDALSGGRAEPVLGRGSFIESFGLYGFDLADYEKLFEEKLEVFSLLREEGPVTYRTPLADVDVFPKTEGGRMRSWVAVGGSPQSVVRAARRGFGLQLAIIGGPAQRFKPFAVLYRRAVDEFGVTTEMPVAVHSPGHVAETDELYATRVVPLVREMLA